MKSCIYIRYMLLIAFVSVCITVFAGDGEDEVYAKASRKSDSLKNELKNPSLTEHQKMTVYSEIVQVYTGYAMDSVIKYGFKTIEIAEKLDDKQMAALQYSHVGVAYGLLNKYDTAIILLNKVHEIGVETGIENIKTNAIWLSAYIYANQGKYVTAIDLYLKLLPVYESNSEHINNHVAALANLAELNRKLGNTSVAIKWLDQAGEHCKKLSGGHYEWRMSHIYNEYSTLYLSNGNTGLALKYALKADSVNNGGFIINKCTSKVLLAKIYLVTNDYERALQYAAKAMEYADMLKSNSLYLDARKVMSDIYLAQQCYPEAEAEALKAWNADSTNINESRIIAANIALANIHMHNTEKAVRYFKKYFELNELYSEKSFHTTVSDMSIKYETEKKEILIHSINRQKLLYLYISITVVVLAVLIWIVFQQKVRRERTEKRLVAIRAILEGENNERQRIARDLHDGLGGIILSVKMELDSVENTQNIRNKLNECIDEIHHIATGMMPSSLIRFGIKAAIEDCCLKFPGVQFHFFGADERIDSKTELAIYYCACELVNNAIKHSGATVIDVQLVQEKHRISLIVQDNGKGFDVNTAAGKGFGLKNINHRVIAFNGKMNTVSSPGNGTETNIEFEITA